MFSAMSLPDSERNITGIGLTSFDLADDGLYYTVDRVEKPDF
jgi:hypothetical protein